MELADDGLTTAVLIGFLAVWMILLYGDANEADDDD